MGNVIVIAVLLVIVVIAVKSFCKKLTRGGGCCGEHEPAEKKVKVVDRKQEHYPFILFLQIDGMTCSNCILRVENALNRLEGVWAQVYLDAGRVELRAKKQPDEELLRKTVADAGYTVLSITRTNL